MSGSIDGEGILGGELDREGSGDLLEEASGDLAGTGGTTTDQVGKRKGFLIHRMVC